MSETSRREKAEAFRKMHDRSRILVLPNAWNAMSAKAIEAAGALAIATSSAGVAYSLGYADGERAPREEIVAAIARIARVSHLPVSADIEAGFGADAAGVARMVAEVIRAGAVGINLEDATRDRNNPLHSIDAAVARVHAAREAANAAGVPIVINARTDVYLLGVGTPESRFEHALARLRAYRDAGGDCLFIPAIREDTLISKFVKELNAPINILAGPGFPTVRELEQLGVARVSVGSGPARAAMMNARKIAEELLGSGTYSLMEGAI
ncbi:MAG TPA: isocitrate lyase/phosphoenolpyruvate mutase family protein, partial [Candidatus Binataceae bacterium]